MDDLSARRNEPILPPVPEPLEVREFLEVELQPLVERRIATVAALDACVAKYPTIENDEVEAIFAQNIVAANGLASDAKDRHDEYKGPYYRAGKAVDEWFPERVTTALTSARQSAQKILTDYKLRKDAKVKAEQAEEARKARALAEAAAAEAARVLRSQTASPDRVEATTGTAVAAAVQADKAQAKVDAKASTRTKTRTETGVVSSLKTTWRVRVLDESKVPRQFLSVDKDKYTAALVAAGRDADGKPNVDINQWRDEYSIEIYADHAAVTRSV